MHCFQPSRGRIFFEVLCAVGIAASCGGAWMQTGASALLAAASVATLYGLVHFFDLFRRDPSLAVEAQRIDFTSDGDADLSTVSQVAEPEPAVEKVAEVIALDPRLTDFGERDFTSVEPVAAPAGEVAPAKASRKGGRRAAGSQSKAKTAESKLCAEVPVEALKAVIVEEATHTQVAPLFEPDPFHRMPRQGFGRRGQI